MGLSRQKFWSQLLLPPLRESSEIRGIRDQILDIFWIIKKAREYQKKHLLLFYWLHQSLWLCRSQQTEKFFKRWEYQITLSASWEIYMQVKKQQLEHGTTHWFQFGKKVCQDYISSPCLFNLYSEYIMQNAGLDETQAGIKIAGRNINNLSLSVWLYLAW